MIPVIAIILETSLINEHLIFEQTMGVLLLAVACLTIDGRIITPSNYLTKYF